MVSYRSHPDDEWIEITAFGDAEPRYILGKSGAADEVATARAKYEAGQLPLEHFEAVLERNLEP